jgi:N-methylhydantoinase A
MCVLGRNREAFRAPGLELAGVNAVMKYRLGCDIGGTFTDFVLLDEETGAFEMGKVLTTPDDPSEAVDAGIGDLLERVPRFLEQTENVIHGTTLVINAIIQRQGARTALITTKGFRDIIAMRREMRYDTHDIAAVFPAPIVSRAWRREVDERVHGDGRIATTCRRWRGVGGRLFAAFLREPGARANIGACRR